MVDEKDHERGSMQKILDNLKQAKPAYVARRDDSVDRHTWQVFKRQRECPGKFHLAGERSVPVRNQDCESRVREDGRPMASFEDKKLTVDEFIEGYEIIEREKLNRQIELKRSSTKVSFSPTTMERSVNKRPSKQAKSHQPPEVWPGPGP